MQRTSMIGSISVIFSVIFVSGCAMTRAPEISYLTIENNSPLPVSKVLLIDWEAFFDDEKWRKVNTRYIAPGESVRYRLASGGTYGVQVKKVDGSTVTRWRFGMPSGGYTIPAHAAAAPAAGAVATKNKSTEEMVEALLEVVTRHYGSRPVDELHRAAAKGNAHSVQSLLRSGTAVDSEIDSGATPLLFAFLNEDSDVIEALLSAGADINHQGSTNHTTPLVFVVGAELEKTARKRIAQRLLERGADPNIPTKNGDTPLHVAAKSGELDLAEALIDAGANAFARNQSGHTANDLITAYIQRQQQKAVAEERKRRNLAELERKEDKDRAFVIGALTGVAAAAGASSAGLDTDTGAEVAARIGMAAHDASMGNAAGAAGHLDAASSTLQQKIAAQRAMGPASGSRNVASATEKNENANRSSGSDSDDDSLCRIQAGWGAMKSKACKQREREQANGQGKGGTGGPVAGGNSEGYRHFNYVFSCVGNAADYEIRVPYKTQAGLDLTKRYTRANMCDPQEAERIASQCRSMNRPHCIEQ